MPKSNKNKTVDIAKSDNNKTFSPNSLHKLEPKSYPQEQFIEAFYNQTPMIIQQGAAGTGKTVLALYCALYDVFRNNHRKVLILRSAVQAREIGHLPGALEEKMDFYKKPYRQLCDELLQYKSNNFKNLEDSGVLEFDITSFLRGVTYDDTIIIVDEYTNMDLDELKTIVTRVGVNSRIIFCGDIAQSDLNRRKNEKSGYYKFMEIVENMPSEWYDVIEYTSNDVIRSDLAGAFIKACEKAE